MESMNEEERRGPIALRDGSVRRGRKSSVEEEARAFPESQGLLVGICEKCGHVAGTNGDCEDCAW
jgi:hypothetical protein